MGGKKGKPWMWSQCKCDWKMWKVADLPPLPLFMKSAPKSLRPDPASRIMYSVPEVWICTQDVLHPYVPETEKGRLWSMQSLISSSVFRSLPLTASSA